MSDERRLKPDPSVELAYMEWHRKASMSRYVDEFSAHRAKQCDIDSVEVRDEQPVALVETTREPVESKTSTWTKRLADRADLPCYVVQYVLAEGFNPHTTAFNVRDIAGFRVRSTRSGRVVELTPGEYAEFVCNDFKLRGTKAA